MKPQKLNFLYFFGSPLMNLIIDSLIVLSQFHGNIKPNLLMYNSAGMPLM